MMMMMMLMLMLMLMLMRRLWESSSSTPGGAPTDPHAAAR